MSANICHTCDFAVGILSWDLFVSVSVGCLMQVCFCDGSLQSFSDQDWEPGLFPPGLCTDRGNQCVWLILDDVCSVEGTEPPNLPKPCSTYLATSLYQGVNTSALHTKDAEQKKPKSWCEAQVCQWYNSPFSQTTEEKLVFLQWSGFKWKIRPSDWVAVTISKWHLGGLVHCGIFLWKRGQF